VSGLCLSRSEIQELTGTPIRARQIQFLVKNGIRHYVDLHGRAVVLRAALDGAQPAAKAAPEWVSNKTLAMRGRER